MGVFLQIILAVCIGILGLLIMFYYLFQDEPKTRKYKQKIFLKINQTYRLSIDTRSRTHSVSTYGSSTPTTRANRQITPAIPSKYVFV
jgi:hypothetical protein